MFTTSFVRRSLMLAALFAPLGAQAQETQLFTWSGRVDRQVRLTVQGSQLSNSAEQNMQTRGRFMETRALPREEGTLRVVTSAGRGEVQVLQQPNAQNGYTALIALIDNDGGADNYRVTAYFTPTNGRGYGNNGRYGDNGNNGRYGDNGNNGRYGSNDNDGRYGNNDNDGRGRGRGRDRDRDGIPDREERRDARSRVPTLHWSGDVDGEVQLVWREGGVNQRLVSGAAPRVQANAVSGDVSNARGTQLSVIVREGRGHVDVVQQPSAQNRYTGIIRIVDSQRGYGHYDFEAAWH